MSPPELTGNTPVVEVFHPVDVDFAETVRLVADSAVLYSVYCRLYHRAHFNEPLVGGKRLNRVSATVALTYVVAVRLNFNEVALCFEVGNDLLSCFVVEQTEFSVKLGDVRISSFRTPHDSRASVGYRITLDGETPTALAYATDIGYITPEILENLMGCESVVLESNHDPDMLMDGPYPYDLKLRFRGKKGHLPNEECAAVAAQLYASGTKNILLAHLSEQNNTPRLAFHETFCAIGDKDFNLRVADPVHVSWLVP